MRISRDTVFRGNSNCCICDANATRNAIYCPKCESVTCISCAEGGNSSPLGKAARIGLGFMTMGTSELGRLAYRKANIKCQKCGNKSNLIYR